LHRLRSGPLVGHVPVIAVTAFAMAEDHANAARAGFDGYLEKPISARSLTGQVADFLRDGAS
jgi:two-component system cell cycle response regulator DivK